MRTTLRAVGIASLCVTAIFLVGCSPVVAPTTPTPAPSTSSAPSSPTQSPTPAPAPVIVSAFPCADPAPTAPVPSAEEMARYREVITSGNTQAMASTSCGTITYILSGTECCGPTPRDNALVDWATRLNPGTAEWSFDIDPATLTLWRSQAYAQYVPEGSLIAVDNASGRVTSVIFDGNVVSAIFVSSLEEMMY